MKFTHCAAYSFGSGFKCLLNKISDPGPGPGQYNQTSLDVYKKKNPNYRIGTAKRAAQVINKNPGPGAYEVKTDEKTSPPKYSFHNPLGDTKSRLKLGESGDNFKGDSSGTPGPGTYNIRTDKSLEVPTYKFGTDKKCKDYQTSCAPNHFYNTVGSPGDNTPKFSFGKDPKGTSMRPTTPGPKYETMGKFGSEAPKFSFGKEQRGTLSRATTPGPGKYKIRKSFGADARKITISPYGRDQYKYNSFPGPGAYRPNSNTVKRRYPTYKIGSAKRRQLYESDPNFPSPTTYNPNPMANSTRPGSPSWRIGTGKRPKLYNTSIAPGPGMYNMSSRSTQGPRYTLRGKYKLKTDNCSPGPGMYNNDTQKHLFRNPAWKIGTSQRNDDLKRVVRDGYPGPGNYRPIVKRKNSNNIKIGKEKRSFVLKKDTPGPGQYKIPCEFDNVNDYTRQQGKFDENYRYV